VAIWYIFPIFVCCAQENLATLAVINEPVQASDHEQLLELLWTLDEGVKLSRISGRDDKLSRPS
jgi:hypothetical protein